MLKWMTMCVIGVSVVSSCKARRASSTAKSNELRAVAPYSQLLNDCNSRSKNNCGPEIAVADAGAECVAVDKAGIAKFFSKTANYCTAQLDLESQICNRQDAAEEYLMVCGPSVDEPHVPSHEGPACPEIGSLVKVDCFALTTAREFVRTRAQFRFEARGEASDCTGGQKLAKLIWADRKEDPRQYLLDCQPVGSVRTGL